MKARLLFTSICAGIVGTASVGAQSFFKLTSTEFFNPTYPGGTLSESSAWSAFTSAYNGPNTPNVGPSSTPAVLTQVLEPNAVATFEGHIYSFSGPTGYEVVDATPLSSVSGTGPKSVNFQWDTLGVLMDFSSLKLIYTPVGGGSPVTLSPTNQIAEYLPFISDFGLTHQNRLSAQWNLTDYNVASYKIVYQSAGPHNSLASTKLDVANIYTEITPSTRVWNGSGGNTTWSTTANWDTSTVASARGNVVFAGGSGVSLDVNREVSELTLSGPTGFTISATGGAKLQTNTGITSDPSTARSYFISAPLVIGAFNFMTIGANADVTLSGPVSGVEGFRRLGDGTLRLTNNNTFGGQLVIEGGTTYLGGTNAYEGPTTVYSGRLLVQGNAAMAGGVLGTSNEDVFLSGSSSAEAAVIIDGAYTIAKNFMMADGTDSKKVGGQNTGSGSAVFSGNVTLSTSAANVNLHAENASDRVVFSGSITGGTAGFALNKTGAGTVVYSGPGVKNYANRTNINAGTLEIGNGLTFTGNDRVTVGSGAKLLVHGELAGSGTLFVSGGTIAGNGTISRAFTIDTGDTLSPGASIGLLTTVNENWGTGGRFVLELGNATSTAGTGWDAVSIGGTLNVSATAGAGVFTLALQTLNAAGAAGLMQNFNASQSYSWPFASGFTSLTNFTGDDIAIDPAGFANALNGGSFNISNSGNALYLNFVPVPEPNTGSLCVLGIAVVALWRNRRFISGRDHLE